MKDRTQNLLKNIIQEYVKSAQPVGSKFLVENCGLKLSSATVRNEMAGLEKEGYICQPHTSAGRVPTEKGYLFYIGNFMEDAGLRIREKKAFRGIRKRIEESYESAVKQAAKSLAEISGQAVLVGFGPRDVFYTGIANLFSQPEFREANLIRRISEVLDHLDSVMEGLFPEIGDDVRILVGRENPFGEACGAVLAKYDAGNDKSGLLGILGPMRMDYGRNVSLLRYLKESINP